MNSCEQKEQKIDDAHITKLYYGFNRVYFKECTGKTFTLNNKVHSFKSLSDEKSIKIVKQRRLPQIDLGIEYSHLLLPSMPCHDIEIINSDKNTTANNKANGLISLSPLIKTKESDYSVNKNIIGYKSGVRSALICIENKEEECQWYRLKGCGNNNIGYFPFECIEDGQSPLVQIRGCCFKHTAFRELKMTNDITQILNKYNIHSANESHGWYEYDIDKYCNKVIRTCAVFKTKGNKRFGDHLMNGLLKILPIIIDMENVSISDIYNLFPQIRKQQMKDMKWKVMQTYLAVLCEIEIINLNLKNDGNDIKIALKECIDVNGDLKWLFGDANDCKYKESLWRYQCDKYNEIISNIDDKEIINRLVIDIFYRLGFESGFIQKLLHLNNISWGTYNDSLGTHCNAHCNNYVILPYHEFIKYNFCLAPLDFDMAFYENEYIEDMEEKQYTFDELIVMECNGNRVSLSGDPEISTGVHWKEEDDGYKYEDNEERNKFDLINWALRDTLICSFDRAYNNKHNNEKYIFEWNENKQKLMYAIFNLALIATLDVVA